MTSKRGSRKKSVEEDPAGTPVGPVAVADPPVPNEVPGEPVPPQPEVGPSAPDPVAETPEPPAAEPATAQPEEPSPATEPAQAGEVSPTTVASPTARESAPAAPVGSLPEVDDDDDPDDPDDPAAQAAGLRERIEALLFSAPKPLRSAEIAEFCSVPKDDARASLRALRAEYRKRKSGLEIVKIDGRYQMRVRRGAEEAARLVSPTDISRDLLKTVTVIAFYQPMLQSELVEMVGSKAYDHVRELEERKLIRSAPYAQTKALATGLAFAEYFGLKTGRPEEVRKWVAKRLGKQPPGPRRMLTPALMAAEAALDPGFVAGRAVESPPTPDEVAPPIAPVTGDPATTPRSAGPAVLTEVAPSPEELGAADPVPQPPAES